MTIIQSWIVLNDFFIIWIKYIKSKCRSILLNNDIAGIGMITILCTFKNGNISKKCFEICEMKLKITCQLKLS